MTIQYTTRAGLPHPQGSDAAVVHADLEALAEATDSAFALYSSGTRSERPGAPYKDGRIFRQTDSAAGYPPGTLWFDNGTGWILLFDPNGTTGTPTGVMVDFAGIASQVPTGWIACDGSAVTAAVAPLLRDFLIAAGSPYGSVGADPRTPDFRGRVAVGLDNMGGTDAGRLDVGNTLGGTGGSQYHTLVTGEMPAHTHPITVTGTTTGITASTVAAGTHSHTGTAADAGSHAHTASTGSAGAHRHNLRLTSGANTGAVSVPSGAISNNIGSAATTRFMGQGSVTFNGDTDEQGSHGHTVTVDNGGSHSHSVSTVDAGSHSHTVNIADSGHTHSASSTSTGGGTGHNNMQPFILVTKIIKA